MAQRSHTVNPSKRFELTVGGILDKKIRAVRTRTFKVRMTPDEYERLYDSARIRGMNPSEFFRFVMLGAEAAGRLPNASELSEIVQQMRRQGNNMNQIVRAVNEARMLGNQADQVLTGYARDIKVARAELTRMKNCLKGALGVDF